MYNIYSSLSSADVTQGINTFKVFYDSLMTGVTCKDDSVYHSYYKHLLFDKVDFNLDSSDKSIILNLGLYKSDLVNYTGNDLIDVVFDQSKKIVWVFTLSSLDTSFYPKIYKYDINNHNIKLEYPLSEDLTQWINIGLGSLTAAHLPVLSVENNKVDIAINSIKDSNRIINLLTFDVTSNPQLIDYTKYSLDLNSSLKIKKIQRVNDELHFYAEDQQNIIPFKITDK